MNIECEQSFTPRDVYQSILQAHGGFVNSESFTSESHERNFERTFERTYEHSYQQNYESNVSSDKTTRNISRKTDQFIISNENTLEAKQNETQLEHLPDGNRSHGKLEKRRSRSKSTRISKGARRDREPSRLPWKKILNLLTTSQPSKDARLARRQRIVPREEWRMRKNSRSALKSVSVSVSVRCKV